MNAVVIAGLALCTVGALLHGVIFVLESIARRGARARRVFGLGEDEARITASLAFNQGFITCSSRSTSSSASC